MRLPVVLLAAAVCPVVAAELAISDIALRPFDDVPPMPRPSFVAGSPVILTFRVQGFTAARENQALDLAYKLEAFDPSKRPVAESKTGQIKVELAPEDKDWAPKVRWEFQIPPVPEPGRYSLVLTVEDRLAKKTATVTSEFRVDARKVPDLSALGVHNFRFLQREDDINGVELGAVYRPGATLWARFDVAGYKFGPKNRYAIRYGLALRNSAGRVLFEEPKAASESEESFYPKLFTTGTFSLNLDKDIPPGEYTLIVTVSDELGNQSVESTHLFRVDA